MKTAPKNAKRRLKAEHDSRSTVQFRSHSQRERVLVEFPSELLQQTDEAARATNRNRSELIRSAVERFLNEMEAKSFERSLAAAYEANSKMNRALCEEFETVDREGF